MACADPDVKGLYRPAMDTYKQVARGVGGVGEGGSQDRQVQCSDVSEEEPQCLRHLLSAAYNCAGGVGDARCRRRSVPGTHSERGTHPDIFMVDKDREL